MLFSFVMARRPSCDRTGHETGLSCSLRAAQIRVGFSNPQDQDHYVHFPKNLISEVVNAVNTC